MRKRLAIALSLGVVVAGALIGFCVWPRHPFRATLSVQQFTETGYMVLFLTNTGSVLLEFELATNMQVRAGGKWLPVDRHALAGDLVCDLYAPPGEYRVAETLCSQREAEACRFRLRYRALSLRWRAECYLTERDLFQRAPWLFGWLTKRIPEHARWRQTELEFELPKGPIGRSQETKGPRNQTRKATPEERVRFCWDSVARRARVLCSALEAADGGTV
jgi:hypothetical protein